jgi:hypothetical protein
VSVEEFFMAEKRLIENGRHPSSAQQERQAVKQARAAQVVRVHTHSGAQD